MSKHEVDSMKGGEKDADYRMGLAPNDPRGEVDHAAVRRGADASALGEMKKAAGQGDLSQ
ncbi:hypothetical protein [Paenibacillus humicus]|uniref:hypothetical protein n=1 Tax=Paenibacillus humicus TaxID=412861 RepID=UPI003F165BA6